MFLSSSCPLATPLPSQQKRQGKDSSVSGQSERAYSKPQVISQRKVTAGAVTSSMKAATSRTTEAISEQQPTRAQHPCCTHTPALTGNQPQAGQTRERHDKEKYLSATFTKGCFLVLSISFIACVQHDRNPQGHFSIFRSCNIFYSLKWMLFTTALWFLMLCFGHFSLFMSLASQCSSWTRLQEE